jgi:hypothetical protein
MVEHELNRADGILTIRPHGRLEAADFEAIARDIDPYIEANGSLHGLMVDAEAFPGWADFAAAIAHFKFVRGHHSKIEKVAVVSDSSFLRVAPRVAAHFVRADLRHFSSADRDAANAWLRERV